MSDGYSLFIDDVRDPSGAPNHGGRWRVARHLDEVQKIIDAHGPPEAVSFDHDLGIGCPNGVAVAEWMIDHDVLPEHWGVHSANPIGADRIREVCKDGVTSSMLREQMEETDD